VPSGTQQQQLTQPPPLPPPPPAPPLPRAPTLRSAPRSTPPAQSAAALDERVPIRETYSDARLRVAELLMRGLIA
jgi:hypothetical protein